MGVIQFFENFESPYKDWFFTGGAGFDFGKGLARRGQGNAWVRNTAGWNAINRWWNVQPHSICYVHAWLRLSPNLTDGYISVRHDEDRQPDGKFDVIREIKLVGPGPQNPENANYNPYTFEFYSGNNARVLFYIGLWGNGKDSWIQIDEVFLSVKTPY